MSSLGAMVGLGAMVSLGATVGLGTRSIFAWLLHFHALKHSSARTYILKGLSKLLFS